MPSEKNKVERASMSVRSPSKASERHTAVVAAKEELLSEIQHWLKSSGRCIAEIRESLTTLRNAQALVKRDIHMARATVEIKLKELEAATELQMSTMVNAEVETLSRFQKRLTDQRQKLEFTESTLQKNCVGSELKRNIEEAQLHLKEMRQSIVASKKHPRPTEVEFSIHDELIPFINKERDLGTLRVKSNQGTVIRSSETSETLMNKSKRNMTPTSNTKTSWKGVSSTAVKSVSVRKEVRSRLDTSIEIIEDFEKLIQQDLNDVQPFFEVATNLSLDGKSVESSGQTKGTKNKYGHVEAKIDARNDLRNMIVQRIPGPNEAKPQQRSTSAYKRVKTARENYLDTRISTSAREDSRTLSIHGDQDVKPTMKYLNNTDFVAYEEQGPEQKVKKPRKEKLSVSYAEYDTIKEITMFDDQKWEKPYPPDAYVDIYAYPGPRKILSAASTSSNTSMSSVSYKPSSAHASGPVYVPQSETWQSKSYFTYIARFHTKKHPRDTDLCRLTGIATLDNGQILTADINHLKVMLFGPDFTYLSDLECPSPCGVCKVKGDIIAVTLFHNRKILLLKVCMLHLERHKEMHVNCPETLYAVRYRDNHFCVLCFAGHVHVMEDSGKQVKLIETHLGNGMARNLEVDGKRKLLYISGLESVSSFFFTGDLCWQFTAKTTNKTFSPGGIVLHNDRLFVTDWGNHRVLELSLDGTFIRDVISDNLEFPHAMAVQQSTGRIFITQSNMFRQEARSRSIKVFSIK